MAAGGNAQYLQARAHERERVGRKLRDAGGEHAGAQDGVGRGGPVILVEQALLQDLERRNVHAGVRQDANLRAQEPEQAFFGSACHVVHACAQPGSRCLSELPKKSPWPGAACKKVMHANEQRKGMPNAMRWQDAQVPKTPLMLMSSPCSQADTRSIVGFCRRRHSAQACYSLAVYRRTSEGVRPR